MTMKVTNLESLHALRFLTFCNTYNNNMCMSGPSLLIESTNSMIHPYYISVCNVNYYQLSVSIENNNS